MPGLNAVPGGEHIGQVGAHPPVDPQRPPHSGLHARRDGQVGVGSDPNDDQDQDDEDDSSDSDADEDASGSDSDEDSSNSAERRDEE